SARRKAPWRAPRRTLASASTASETREGANRGLAAAQEATRAAAVAVTARGQLVGRSALRTLRPQASVACVRSRPVPAKLTEAVYRRTSIVGWRISSPRSSAALACAESHGRGFTVRRAECESKRGR